MSLTITSYYDIFNTSDVIYIIRKEGSKIARGKSSIRRIENDTIIPDRIWKDKKISFESKFIYAYLYSKAIGKTIVNLNVGELQQVIKITNVGLRKNLEILEKYKYILQKEYDNGMYVIHVY